MPTDEMKQRIAEMKASAEEARTGDSWREGTANVWCEASDECIAVTYRNRLSRQKQLAIAAFIAAANPAAVLALIAEIERLERENAELSAIMKFAENCTEHTIPLDELRRQLGIKK